MVTLQNVKTFCKVKYMIYSNYLMISGKKLRIALRSADITQEAAANKLGVSRQTLSVWAKSEELNADILHNVKMKLGIDLTSEGRHSASYADNENDDNPRTLNSPEVLYDAEQETEYKTSGPGIPMYSFPASASMTEMYGDVNEVKIIGYLNIPGSIKGSFALPVHGHSMYPTLESGSWCVLRPITDTSDIDWGQIYYIEYGDYRLFKRLLQADQPDSVVLWSDNQSDVINGRAKYAAKTIKLERIKRLCLLTDILKKPNY
jgi:phage repressor protein C with HTH and peptisase S24 domain